MKSVTITMIDGVCFIGVCSSAPGTGRVLGEGHQREIAAVFTSRGLTVPPEALTDCRVRGTI